MSLKRRHDDEDDVLLLSSPPKKGRLARVGEGISGRTRPPKPTSPASSRRKRRGPDSRSKAPAGRPLDSFFKSLSLACPLRIPGALVRLARKRWRNLRRLPWPLSISQRARLFLSHC